MNEDLNQECAVTGNTLKKNETPLSSATTKLVGIYGLQNKLKPDKWYVGFSSDIIFRWQKQYQHLQCKKQRKIYNALLKYGYDGFEKVVLEECEKSKLGEREAYWIKEKDSVKRGYNIASGGIGGALHCEPHRESSKKLISLKRKGYKMKEEQKQLLSLASSKQKHTEETKRKISEYKREWWKNHSSPRQEPCS